MLSLVAELFITFSLLGFSLGVDTGYRLANSSGCAAQMVFLPPYSNKVVFIDNYHENRGGPGMDMQTGAHDPNPYVYPGTTEAVFSTEYDLTTWDLRPLRPVDNTFCSAGAFFPDGTMLNIAGAEATLGTIPTEGFDHMRTYAPCNPDGTCGQDWVESTQMLRTYRWYPSSYTLTDGSIVVVGGSKWGGLVVNEADINVDSYEVVTQTGKQTRGPIHLPILGPWTTADNPDGNRLYNLFPHLHMIPNGANNNILTIAGNQAVIWDYGTDKLVKTLPDTPLQPRCFPSAATSVLLPLVAPNYDATVLICGGASTDKPNPQALGDCYTIDASAPTPKWTQIDDLPNGPQVMSDGILLPDGTVLLINGAHKGSSGAGMAENPVFTPLIYTPGAPAGSQFKSQPKTAIPRLYHSSATLLPNGEVLIAGGNPSVGYDGVGQTNANRQFPNGQDQKTCYLNTQQNLDSRYPTEYRIEIFSPPYMRAADRPVIVSPAPTLTYAGSFQVQAKTAAPMTVVQIVLHAPGFHTHGLAMGQRMVVMDAEQGTVADGVGTWNVNVFEAPSVMPPGIYLMFVVIGGIPSEAQWVTLGAAPPTAAGGTATA